jgi:ribosomal protein S27AE
LKGLPEGYRIRHKFQGKDVTPLSKIFEEKEPKPITARDEWYNWYYRDSPIEGSRYNWFEEAQVSENDEGKILIIDEYHGCPECGHIVKVADHHKSEMLCKKCGCVIGCTLLKTDNQFFKGRTFEELQEDNGLLRKDEKRFVTWNRNRIERIRNPENPKVKRNSTNMKEWRINQQYRFIIVAGKSLNLRPSEIKKVKNIVYTYNLKKFHEV